jgi:hypothetical protein
MHLHEVQILIGENFKWDDYLEMRKWCVENVDSENFYVHPPKEIMEKPARFQFAKESDEFAFKMTFGVHDIDDTFESRTIDINIQ